MNITRQNYEEWLLLYVDNELSLAERIIVDDFLAANPDLQQELDMLQQSILSPEEEVVFESKSSLYKSSSDLLITAENCEQYFILYGDDELSNEQKAAVEQFVYHNPRFQSAFELIQMVKLQPDTSIVFPNKKSLYRSEKKRRVVAMRWYRIAAAAVLLLLIGGVSYKWLVKDTAVTQMANRKQLPSSEQSARELAIKDLEEKLEAELRSSRTLKESNPSLGEQLPVTDKAPANTSGVRQNNTGKTNIPKPSGNAASQVATITIPSPITTEKRKVADAPTIEDYAVNNPEKKFPTGSNPAVASSVTITDAVLNDTEKPNTGKININNPGKLALNNTNDMAAIAEPSYDLMGDDDFNPVPVSDKKKSMRGILRKMSRVFEKATNADASDNPKGNIRIANFEIALK